MLNPRKRIDQSHGNVQVAFIDSHGNKVDIIYSPQEYIQKLLREGNLNDAVTCLSEITKLYEQAHPLWPNYTYKPVSYGNKTVLDHVPVNKQASQEFPLHYKGEFTIDKKNFSTSFSLDELMNRAYVNQQEIEINIKYLETWIGDTRIDDEGTLIREAVKDAKWALIPNELPPPIKVKIVREEDITIFDYIELTLSDVDNRTNTIVLDNSKQDSSKHIVTIIIDRNNLLQETNQGELVKINSKVNIAIKEEHKGNIIANYKMLLFILSTLKSHGLSFVNLETGNDLVVANNYKVERDESISKIEKELEFLKRLIKIEKHFNVEFTLPRDIEASDDEAIDILLSIIENREIKGTFNDLVLDFNQREGLADLISQVEKLDELKFKMNSSIYIELFNQTISDIIKEDTLENLTLEDEEKIKRKYADMEDGETIKVKFIPNSKNQITTVYKWSDALH